MDPFKQYMVLFSEKAEPPLYIFQSFMIFKTKQCADAAFTSAAISDGDCDKLPGFAFGKEGITPLAAGGASRQGLPQTEESTCPMPHPFPGKPAPSWTALNGHARRKSSQSRGGGLH